MAAVARRITQQELRKPGGRKLGLIVIDYLQLLEPDNPKDPRQEQVAKIARRLKMLAREQRVRSSVYLSSIDKLKTAKIINRS